MKLATLLLLLIAAAPAWCQRGGPMRSPAFDALDVDRDGAISTAELSNAAKSLKSLDRDGDGKLAQAEVAPQMGGRRGRVGEGGEASAPAADEMVKTFMAFDKNGDGQLTRDELPERMHGLFDRADSDKNSSLSANEIRRSAQATSAPAGRGGGEGRNNMRLDPILAALDTDSDGEISAAEVAAAPTALKKLDSNGDGQLSGGEARPNFGPRRGRGAV
jgi:Ca2+-binding EF-hand superfamily protein